MSPTTSPSPAADASPIATPDEAADASPIATAGEAAKFLHTTKGTLAVWRCNGTYALPFIKRGRKVFYRRADLAAFAENPTLAPAEAARRAKEARKRPGRKAAQRARAAGQSTDQANGPATLRVHGPRRAARATS